MTNMPHLKIEFTDILYGVVISIVITKLSLNLSTKNFMLAFALLIIFDDWLTYHIDISSVKLSAKGYFLGYIFDISVLLCWYFITIVTPSKMSLFLLFVVLFFLICVIWSLIFRISDLKSLHIRSDFQLFVIYLLVLVLSTYLLQLSANLLIGLCTFIFIIVRIPEWKRLLNKSLVVFSRKESDDQND